MIVVLALLAALQLCALGWQVCPVCGNGFSGLTPGAPCSSVCSARQRRDDALGKPPEGRHRANDDPFAGSRTPSGRRRADPPKGGKCSIVLGGLVAAPAVLTALAIRLARR